MNIKNVDIGLKVVRSKGDYVVGRTGNVIEIDHEKERARVQWDGYNITWVKVDCIEPIMLPYKILPSTYDSKGRRIKWPKYVPL
jgi:hypothetical protein